jgi:hypothetical protein
MGEERQESGSATSAATLHGAGRDIEHAGGFGDRVALHVHQDERGALVGRQRTEGLQQLPVQILALSRSLCLLVRLQQLLQPLSVVDRGGLA